MDDFVELFVFDEESVVGEFGDNACTLGAGDEGCHFIMIFRGEEDIAADTDDDAFRTYAPEGGGCPATPATYIVGVRGAAHAFVAVDIEAIGEFFPLVCLIGMDAAEEGWLLLFRAELGAATLRFGQLRERRGYSALNFSHGLSSDFR